MRKKFYGLFVICMLLGLSSCDDFLDDVKSATEYDKPELVASIDTIDKTLVVFKIPNIIDVEHSHGNNIDYTGHYIKGEFSKITTEGSTEFPLYFCEASTKAGYYFPSFTGKYTFWVTGKYTSGGAGKTDPSNVVVLDFVQ